MNKFEFKNALQKLKESKQQNQNNDKKYVKYGDVIQEKLLNQKRNNSTVHNDFKKEVDERDEYNKNKNANLNKEQEKKLAENKEKLINTNEGKDNKLDKDEEGKTNNIIITKEENENINKNNINQIDDIINDNLIENEVPENFDVDVCKKEWVVDVNPKE
jgi:hypothetical protein